MFAVSIFTPALESTSYVAVGSRPSTRLLKDMWTERTEKRSSSEKRLMALGLFYDESASIPSYNMMTSSQKKHETTMNEKYQNPVERDFRTVAVSGRALRLVLEACTFEYTTTTMIPLVSFVYLKSILETEK